MIWREQKPTHLRDKQELHPVPLRGRFFGKRTLTVGTEMEKKTLAAGHSMPQSFTK